MYTHIFRSTLIKSNLKELQIKNASFSHMPQYRVNLFATQKQTPALETECGYFGKNEGHKKRLNNTILLDD